MRLHLKGNLIKIWAYMSISLVSFIILFLFAFVFYKGRSAISWSFLTESPAGEILGSEGGIFPAIIGSLQFTLVALLFAVIPAVATAVYMVYYCRSIKLYKLLRTIIQCIAGIPSIVLGLFAYSLLVLSLGWGRCVLSGGIALGVMILPFIEVRAEKAMEELPESMIRASYALGTSKAYTFFKIILPGCKGELVSAIILGSCYAMGAAAPLIFTGGVINARASSDLTAPAMALPYHLYNLITQGLSIGNAYGTAFVLMAIVLISNILATLYGRRSAAKWRK